MAAAVRDPRRYRGHPLAEHPHLRLRRTRYRGLARTHVQHVLTAMACNLHRLADWFDNAPRKRRREGRFHALCTTMFPAPA
jgi:hypothetical protein